MSDLSRIMLDDYKHLLDDEEAEQGPMLRTEVVNFSRLLWSWKYILCILAWTGVAAAVGFSACWYSLKLQTIPLSGLGGLLNLPSNQFSG